MDDYLQSFPTTEEAIKIAREVALVHSRAHFNLQKWRSNDEPTLNALTSEPRQVDKKLNCGTNEEKVLGLIWRPKSDTLAFDLDLKHIPKEIMLGQKRPTKREILRTAMSVFDPLGLAAPLTIAAKRILQATWKLGTDWDEEVPDDVYKDWNTWLEHLQALKKLDIPRCYPGCTHAVKRELHTFVDASEHTYAASTYWRTTAADGAINHAAPRRATTSNPTSECSGPTREQSLHGSKRGARAYKPSVAHRLAEIEEETKTTEWRWVPTAHNVADDATREPPADFDQAHRWFRGPEFLRHPEEEWPSETRAIARSPPTGEERTHTARDAGRTDIIQALPDITRFSSWQRLRRATARALQFIDRCKAGRSLREGTHAISHRRTQKTDKGDPNWRQTLNKVKKIDKTIHTSANERKFVLLEARYLRQAELLWLQAIQKESFESELAAVKAALPLSRTSRIRNLALEVDASGLLLVKTRVAAASDVTTETKGPPVVDGHHPYVRLYVQAVHEQLHHAGVEATTNEVRQRLWVLRMRPTIRTVIKSCLRCRIRRATPGEPPTGNLPAARLAHHQRPFSYVGLDYFGPYNVTIGRQHQKRYVALFTCLTTRAVHLEVAGGLSADSAILAIRRMMARRGAPVEIWSDNGTNFHGADAELQKTAREAAAQEASARAIDWRYIPRRPFHGWSLGEACTIHQASIGRHATREMPEGRADDPEALTPNHFLLGGPGRVPLPGSFSDSDTYGRQQWRHAQRLADLFWTRWIREYLPTLQYRREPVGRGNPLAVGDTVIVVDGTLPRNAWMRGRVTATYPGKDGVVRVADITTSTGILRRPTKKLVVLPK
ncbi:hypothetical protein EVAR_37367_1 [Eumeta japonica]|uniref:Integrase catalytic domain-containing protein n=1 Tax=Eumeta variegata TaxID=151549 RepID=A0A4C1ZW06_EUMVA|nr:hypothetical protein EVAR_37367_1 [Eumeta japonica]